MFPAPQKLIISIFLTFQLTTVIGIAVGFGINIPDRSEVLGATEASANLELVKEEVELEEKPVISIDEELLADQPTEDWGYGYVEE